VLYPFYINAVQNINLSLCFSVCVLLHNVYVEAMGIVKISEGIHNQLREASSVFDRSLNSQAEHWIKIGMLSELHPAINYEEIRDLLFKYKNLTIEEIVKKSKK